MNRKNEGKILQFISEGCDKGYTNFSSMLQYIARCYLSNNIELGEYQYSQDQKLIISMIKEIGFNED